MDECRKSRLPRRRLQFGLATLLIVVTVLSVVATLVRYHRDRLAAERNRERRSNAMAAITGAYGKIKYDLSPEKPVESVSLSGRWVDDGVVGHIGALPETRKVVLASTRLTDECMEALGELKSLEVLAIYGKDSLPTRITDQGLAHLKRCEALRELRLDETLVTGTGLAHLKHLGNIREISLDGPRTTDEGIDQLSAFQSLRELRLGGPNVSDEGLRKIGKLPQLTSFSLNCPNVTDEGLRVIRRLKNLEVLRLYETTPFSDATVSHVAGLTKLRKLSLRGTGYSDEGLKHLRDLSQLECLVLMRSRVSDRGLEHLVHLPKLSLLSLTSTDVTDDGCDILQDVRTLRELYVIHTSVSREARQRLRHALPSCAVIW